MKLRLLAPPSPHVATAALTLALTLALVAALAVPARAAEPSAADKTKLEAGEILIKAFQVPGSELPRAQVTAVIEAPMAKVWAVIEKCADYKRTMVRVLESEELSRAGSTVTCRTKVDMPWPFDDLEATTKATHTVEPGKSYRRAWTLVKGTYTRNEGSWTLTPWAGSADRTLVVYEVHAEPTISIPVSIQKRASRSALPDLIEKLRKVSGARPAGQAGPGGH